MQSSNRVIVPAMAYFQLRHACQRRVPSGTLRRHLFDGIMKMLEFLFCRFLLGIWLIFLVHWSLSYFTYMVVWNLVHGPWTLESSMKSYSPWSSTWCYFVRHIIMIPKKIRKRQHLYVNLAHLLTGLCLLDLKMHLQSFQGLWLKHFRSTFTKQWQYISMIGQYTICRKITANV